MTPAIFDYYEGKRVKNSTNGDTAERLSKTLSDEILIGNLSPGFHLSEPQIAARFSVSRTPVREALRHLVASGLAERRPHHGVFVTFTPANRLVDMFELGADLEGNCARHSAVKMTGEEKAALKTLHDSATRLTAKNDIEAYDRHNYDFHELIFRGSHNSYLIDAAITARNRVLPYRRVQFKTDRRLEKSHAEHWEVVDAILRGDGAAAEVLMRNHLIASYQSCMNILNNLFAHSNPI